MRISLTLLLLAITACGGVVKPEITIPVATLDAMTEFDYALWSEVLKTHVNTQGEVDYPTLLQNRAPLEKFVSQLAVMGPKTRPELFKTEQDKLAYYINAYNALTMFNVLNRYPDIKSVTDAKVSFFVLTEFELDGDEVDLRALENDIVRVEFTEPRIHFALNCASVGCPRLPNEPFLPATLEAQLEREAQQFLHEKRNVKWEGSTVWLSEIFNWYSTDFKPTPIDWIRAKAKPNLDLPAKAAVKHQAYDWRLNDSTRL
ncbi:MAG: hypothetical protein ACI9U2_001906 [Bradymonadia bacterium]|jgi:hypothetical protein